MRATLDGQRRLLKRTNKRGRYYRILIKKIYITTILKELTAHGTTLPNPVR